MYNFEKAPVIQQSAIFAVTMMAIVNAPLISTTRVADQEPVCVIIAVMDVPDAFPFLIK